MSRPKPPDPPANRPSRLQMTDIARLANVSVSTVSRALAGNPRLSPDTRERIQELARSLNYQVDAGAQMLRGKRQPTVAVAFPYHPKQRRHFKDPFFLPLLGSIGDALVDSGHRMLVVAVEADVFETVTQAYETRQAIGTILLGQEGYHGRINEIAVRGLPLVVWGARLKDQLYCSVGSDNRLGGLQATEHLLDAGAERILFVGDPKLPELAQRYEGYLEAHRARGLEPDPRLSQGMAFDEAEVRGTLQRLLEGQVRFDAVFACSDVMALVTVSVLRASGLRVPDDVQVVGFDDIGLAAAASPALTSVRQEIEAAGRALVERLFAQLEGREVESLVLPTTLMVRESTRRPGEPDFRRSRSPPR